MNRRTFLGAGAPLLAAGCSSGQRTPSAAAPTIGAGPLRMNLADLRERYREELFGVVLPFWDAHGIDHEHGGIMCSLDYDGKRVREDKHLWFQGRAIWVYSFLYNHFGQDPRHLEIAAKTRDFVLSHAPQPDGWWAEVLSRQGDALKPFSGDLYGMFFVAEGLQEYARATKDEKSLDMALALMKKLFRHIEDPALRIRPQGLWMVNIRIATQILSRWKDPQIAAIADRCVEAIVERHYNPDIGLNNEVLNHDFSRPKGEETKCLPGHSIETLWMVMDEALRRNDQQLWNTCAARIHRHLEVAWDHMFGGLVHWVNVDQGGYVWPPERPVGTDLEFRFVGEYHYMKTLWALNEVLIAALNVFQRTGEEWASRFFGMAQDVIDRKFSMRKHELPGYMLFADRRMTPTEHTARQDNYHPPRQLMLNLLTLDEMSA